MADPMKQDADPPCGCGARHAAPVTRRAFLRALTAASAASLVTGCGDGDMDWLAAKLISPEEEAAIGRQAFQQILAQTPVARDPALHAYVARIGERIVRASNSPYDEWQFVVFDGDQANAFALPGGRVGVFTGMLKVAANEDQLATVLGHEIGHVNARHGAERMVAENAIEMGLNLLAMMLSMGDVEIPPALMVDLGATAADLGIVRPFSRAQELQADKLGLRYMADAGYDPRQAIAFWRRMQRVSGDGGPPTFLATHPSNARRIEELLEQMRPGNGSPDTPS